MQSARVRTYPEYMAEAVIDQQAMIDRAKQDLAKVEFELFAARGISGAIAAPLLAYALGKRYVIIRKANDGSHDQRPYVGDVWPNDRWIFLDDFIATGKTREAVKLGMAEFERLSYGGDPYHLTFAGSYLYNRCVFTTPNGFVPA